MKVLTVKDTILYVEEIPGSEQTRHQREQLTVAKIIGRNFPGMEIGHSEAGVPFLIPEGPHISVSHSRRTVVLASNAQTTVGVDIEEERAELAQVKFRFISATELDVSGFSLLQAWTAKEAAYKCLYAMEIPQKPVSLPDIRITSADTAEFMDIQLKIKFLPFGEETIAVVTP